MNEASYLRNQHNNHVLHCHYYTIVRYSQSTCLIRPLFSNSSNSIHSNSPEWHMLLGKLSIYITSLHFDCKCHTHLITSTIEFYDENISRLHVQFPNEYYYWREQFFIVEFIDVKLQITLIDAIRMKPWQSCHYEKCLFCVYVTWAITLYSSVINSRAFRVAVNVYHKFVLNGIQ